MSEQIQERLREYRRLLSAHEPVTYALYDGAEKIFIRDDGGHLVVLFAADDKDIAGALRTRSGHLYRIGLLVGWDPVVSIWAGKRTDGLKPELELNRWFKEQFGKPVKAE